MRAQRWRRGHSGGAAGAEAEAEAGAEQECARACLCVCLCDAATRFTGDAAHYRDTMQCRYQQRATLCVHEFACLAGSEEAQWTARTEICMYQKAGNQCEMTFGCPTIWGVAAGCEIGLNCTDKRPRPELSLSLRTGGGCTRGDRAEAKCYTPCPLQLS